MGVSVHTMAVIGCEVTDKLHTRTPASCEHRPPARAAKFCSECGVPYVPAKNVPVAGYNDGTDTIETQWGKLEVFHTTDGERYFAGIGVATWTDHNDGAKRTDLPSDVRDKVWRVLEPLGLWDDASFGLWAVAYVSY